MYGKRETHDVELWTHVPPSSSRAPALESPPLDDTADCCWFICATDLASS